MTDHRTRAPHQPTAWTLVEAIHPASNVPVTLTLERHPDGVGVYLLLRIADRCFGKVAFDDLVKANTRLDPDHASVAEQQIAALRHQLAVAEGQRIELEVRNAHLEAVVRAFRATAML